MEFETAMLLGICWNFAFLGFFFVVRGDRAVPQRYRIPQQRGGFRTKHHFGQKEPSSSSTLSEFHCLLLLLQEWHFQDLPGTLLSTLAALFAAQKLGSE